MKYEIFNIKSNESSIIDIFEKIYSLYFNKIYNLAYKMTGNSDAAADIAQETFTQVLSNFDKYKGDSHIYTWIYAIAKNNCFRYLKNSKRKSFYSMEDLIIKAGMSEEEYSEQEKQQYIIQIKDGCLLGLLRCLSLNQRIAFILNVYLIFILMI